LANNNLSVKVTAPSTATTPDGIEFDTSARHWTLSRDITISLRWIDEFLNEPAKTGALSTLIHYARTYSPATTCMMSGLLHTLLCSVLLRDEKASLITPYMLMNYRGTLNSTTEHYLGSLRSFLMCWVELGHFGIEPEVVPLLNGWRLRGNTKGLAVRITCPKKGALSDLEFAGFQQRRACHAIHGDRPSTVSISGHKGIGFHRDTFLRRIVRVRS